MYDSDRELIFLRLVSVESDRNENQSWSYRSNPANITHPDWRAWWGRPERRRRGEVSSPHPGGRAEWGERVVVGSCWSLRGATLDPKRPRYWGASCWNTKQLHKKIKQHKVTQVGRPTNTPRTNGTKHRWCGHRKIPGYLHLMGTQFSTNMHPQVDLWLNLASRRNKCKVFNKLYNVHTHKDTLVK